MNERRKGQMRHAAAHGEDSWKWIWPFPRLRFFLRTGCWCSHPSWSGWRRIDAKGPERVRWCDVCDYTEIR